MTQTLSRAALCLVLCAAPALAQDSQAWDSVDGSFNYEGQDVAITVERESRQAFLFEYREGPEPGDPVSTVRSAPVTLSPQLMQEVEKAAAGAKPAVWKPLRRGASGKLVAELQIALNRSGARLRVDGQFGPATERALSGYQRSRRLSVTGVLDVESRDSLNLFPPTGQLTINQGSRHSETHSADLAGALRLVVARVQRGQEPVKKTIRGKLIDFDHGLQIYAEDEGARYNASGWHPGLDHAASLLGEVTAEAYVFESEDPAQPGEAILIDLRVKATEESRPKGVKAGDVVRVTGLRRIPGQTIQTSRGPRVVPVNVVAVETKKGQKGVLQNGYASAMTPTKKAAKKATKKAGNRTGIAAAIANKGKPEQSKGQAGPR